MWKGLGTRIAAAGVLVPVVIALAWIGGFAFLGFVAVVAGLAAYEWCSMVFAGDKLQTAVHVTAGAIAALLVPSIGLVEVIGFVSVLWIISALAAVQRADAKYSAWSFLGIPYLAAAAISLVILRLDGTHGFFAIMAVFAGVWSADSLAYFAGRSIGGPKLMVSVSPNKTWAGMGGAVFGAASATLLIGWIGGYSGLLALAIVGTALGVIEQGGDLFESAAKRHHGAKDSGGLIPGHGGVLDRVDGLIAAAVAAALLGASRGGIDHAAAGLLVW